MKQFFGRHIHNPSYKRLAAGKPVVFYYAANLISYFLGIERLEQTAELLRSILPQDVFLIGDVMMDIYAVQTDPKYTEDYVRRSVQAFDGITSYEMLLAGYKWHSSAEYNHAVTPFKDMINGIHEAFDFWAEKAHKYDSTLVPAPLPTGVSNRLLYEAGLDSSLWDRHEGVSYETAKEMAELGAKYANSDLKMIVIASWNECSEGAAIVPSVGYKFNPAHAVRDTFAIKPAGGWPEDYYPPS